MIEEEGNGMMKKILWRFIIILKIELKSYLSNFVFLFSENAFRLIFFLEEYLRDFRWN